LQLLNKPFHKRYTIIVALTVLVRFFDVYVVSLLPFPLVIPFDLQFGDVHDEPVTQGSWRKSEIVVEDVETVSVVVVSSPEDSENHMARALG
jgi:hypothetical protein